jgi:hypothetical protein
MLTKEKSANKLDYFIICIPYFLLFQKASTNILLYLIAIGQTAQPSSKAPWEHKNQNHQQVTVGM